ncbi:MAG: DIP1984 family protein [Planctomycetota bacterium]
MKLAEALLERSALQAKLGSLRQRVVSNAVVQEGETPHEDPQVLIGESNGLLDDLETLVARINATNAAATLSDGRTLTTAIARRETLKARHAMLEAAAKGAQKEPDAYSMREVKWVSTLPVKSLRKQADDVSAKIRELNSRIQETNWSTDLL